MKLRQRIALVDLGEELGMPYPTLLFVKNIRAE